ncbi:uncharacterized protein LOC143216546 [Lasioglossum baleicum]|uniref:uncharacterized protein LOC143216546 n=1 Tax=Lasioglossum baleicum TaxID=434251 RepID=UPI003FCEA3C9
MDRWTGKVAVVTGASSGIGAAIVKQLVRNGMVVAGLARRVDKMKELAENLEDCPGNLHPVECDVSKEESVISAFAWVQENLGPVNVLVNNAGITKESSLIDGNLEDWREVFEVNVLGLCVCTREAVRIMRQDGEEGVVINVNSLAAERVPFIPGFSVYPASKRSIAALAQTLRHELTGTRIRVTGISPGLVATELMMSYSTYSEEALASFPTLDPDDVAAAAVYILSCSPNVVVSTEKKKKKALAPPELRYQDPHREAMKLRVLWMKEKPFTKSEELRNIRSLYNQAQKLIQTGDDHPDLIKMIKKGLFLHPTFHGFHGLDDFGIKRADGPPKNADRLRIVCTVCSLLCTESKILPTTMEQKFWSEKVALITGASSGIGKSLVESLVSKGLKVVGIAPSVDKMKLLADELKSKPGKLYPLQCDLTNQSDILRVLEWIEKNLGSLDILINNAAINMKITMQSSDMEDWKKILDVNLLGLTCMTKEALKMMRKKGMDNGMIININDVYSWKMLMSCELPWSPAYIASKIAMTTMTDCLRTELAQLKSNIKVMCISSGLMENSMTAQFLKENPQMALKPKDVADCILFAMQTPENVLIRDMVITPLREIMM